MNDQHPFDEIDALLRDNVAGLVAYIIGKPGKRRGNEMRWGSKAGLGVMVAGRDKGRITRFDGDGKGRSPITFIMEEYGYSFPQALEWSAHWLDLSPDYKPDLKAVSRREEKQKREQHEAESQQQADNIKRVAKAEAIFEASQDAQGTPVVSYLASRGITGQLASDIRWLPPQNGEYGALVAAARDHVGNICAVQRVFLHDGTKAPVDVIKRTNGVMDGAAVRLAARQGDELILAEGPETGMSVWQSWGRETWVALGSVAKLVDTVPTDRPIIIARDADVPNSQADRALNKAVMAMIERGASVFIAMPPNPTKPGYDFNDALQDYGEGAVEEALAGCQAMHANDLPDFVDLDNARAETQKVVSRFFNEATKAEEAPVWLVNIGLGIGKTRTTLVEAGKFIRINDKRKTRAS